MKTVTIATFANPIEAHIAKNKLKAEGIECFLADENISRIYPTGIFEIRLMVKEEDAARAKEILLEN